MIPLMRARISRVLERRRKRERQTHPSCFFPFWAKLELFNCECRTKWVVAFYRGGVTGGFRAGAVSLAKPEYSGLGLAGPTRFGSELGLDLMWTGVVPFFLFTRAGKV